MLTIDLAAIRANYRLIRARIGGAICAAVVKANAYGLGAREVATALENEGCKHFFVAHVSEGLKLRPHLARDTTVYVLNGLLPGSEKASLEADLVPVVNSLDQLGAWRRLAQSHCRALPTVIQIDSGMSRLGMSTEEVHHVANNPAALAALNVSLVMSHLACADDRMHPANDAQRNSFEHASSLLPPAKRSLASSSGVFLGAPFHYDMVRPGAALYGINPTPDEPNPMRPVVTLEARVIQKRKIGTGAGVGYGHTYIADRSTSLATIALGYADGWHRRGLSAAYVDGQRLPFVGRVSMDTVVLDISSTSDEQISTGSLVEIIGPHQDIDTVATQLGTIGYEVLTSLGSRFHRVYRDLPDEPVNS